MYQQSDIETISTLVERIASRKGDSLAATYKDVPDLKEIEEILEKGAGENADTLLFAISGYIYLGEQYTSLGRFSLAAKYRFRALKIAKLYQEKTNKVPEGIESLFSSLLRDRNFYVDDDCLDVKEFASGMMDEQRLNKIYSDRMARRRNLKHDPVEMTEQYLRVIDEVEKEIEERALPMRMGVCHEIWALKASLLAERGLLWRSPAMLNPRVRFD